MKQSLGFLRSYSCCDPSRREVTKIIKAPWKVLTRSGYLLAAFLVIFMFSYVPAYSNTPAFDDCNNVEFNTAISYDVCKIVDLDTTNILSLIYSHPWFSERVITETIHELSIAGKPSATFKWVDGQYIYQVLLVEHGKYVSVYRTAHSEDNQNGEVLYFGLFGIDIPEDSYSTVFENSSPSTQSMISTSAGSASWGQEVGSFNGVTAYSNASVYYGSNQFNYLGNKNMGMKWQCVEYVTRYYYKKYGVYLTPTDAKTYWKKTDKLKRAENGSTNKPWVGDIVVSTDGTHGHVAIVREVGDNYIKVIHQNFTNSGNDEKKKISMKVKKSKGKTTYTLSAFNSDGGYPIKGWMWKK